jgi:guanylate kinase
MIKSEKLIICGASGAGKDFMLRHLIKKGLKYHPKITTRPRRKLETQGVEYDFIENDEFKLLLESNEIKAYQHFIIEDPATSIPSDWYYAISNKNFKENQLFIMTPKEISSLDPEDRKGCFIVYLDIDENTRRNRLSKRNDNNDSVSRRIEADKKDFKDFKDYDLKITDPEFEVGVVYDLMF